MRYIVPFKRVVDILGLVDGQPVSILYENFVEMTRGLQLAADVDEAWYLAQYPDVADSIRQNSFFSTAWHHFAMVGYREGRMPFGSGSSPRSFIPFTAVQRKLKVVPRPDGLHVEMAYDAFLGILQDILTSVPVDEAWYRARYAIGDDVSAAEHFCTSGYMTGNWPFEIAVEEDWYLDTYRDVKKALENGVIKSAQAHFQADGYREGRIPFSNFPVT